MTSVGYCIIVAVVAVSLCHTAAAAAACPRGCNCSPRVADCLVKPMDSPQNIINSMPRSDTKVIRVRADNKTEAVNWELRRSLLSQFQKLSELVLPSSGLVRIGGASFVDLGALITLDLSDNDLYSIAPGTLVSIPLLKTLDISKTSLTHLDGYMFLSLQLTMLNLSFNAIADMDNRVFNGSTVDVLDLSHNNLTEIRRAQIQPLKDLVHLNLSHNHIAVLHDAVFNGFEKLRTINLNSNRILAISAKMFEYVTELSSSLMPVLEAVTLRENRIRDFPDDFLRVVNQIKLLDIDDNPLSCNCRLLWLKNSYLNAVNATCDTNKTCFLNTRCYSDGESVSLHKLPKEKFVCTPAEIEHVRLETDRLVCSARGDPLPEVWWAEPSGKRIKSETDRDDNLVTSSARLSLHSMIGVYTCTARGHAGKETVRQAPAFGIYESRHKYFDTGELVMAVVGTFVVCVLLAVIVFLWRRCTARANCSKTTGYNGAAYSTKPRPHAGVRVA